MTARCAAALAAFALLAGARPARGDGGSHAPATHFAIGIGGYAAVTGVGELGPAAEIELYPARWRRFGVRAAYSGLDVDFQGALFTAGLTYDAAASRPHLEIGIHADLAATAGDPDGDKIGVGGGVQTQLWVLGPVALGLDTTVHLLANRDDIALHLAGTTTLRVSF